MKLSEKLDHMLRQYNYKRQRGYANNKGVNSFKTGEFLEEVDSYIEEVAKEIEKIIPRDRR